MRISPSVEDNTIVGESYLLQLIDELPLDVTLIVIDGDIGITAA